MRVAVSEGAVPEAKAMTWSPVMMSLNDPAVVFDTVVDADVFTVIDVPL
jgi:hypothetical protein